MAKTFSFLVDITTIDKNINSNWESNARKAEEDFKKNTIQRIMKALAEIPNLVMINVDECETEDEAETATDLKERVDDWIYPDIINIPFIHTVPSLSFFTYDFICTTTNIDNKNATYTIFNKMSDK